MRRGGDGRRRRGGYRTTRADTRRAAGAGDRPSDRAARRRGARRGGGARPPGRLRRRRSAAARPKPRDPGRRPPCGRDRSPTFGPGSPTSRRAPRRRCTTTRRDARRGPRRRRSAAARPKPRDPGRRPPLGRGRSPTAARTSRLGRHRRVVRCSIARQLPVVLVCAPAAVAGAQYQRALGQGSIPGRGEPTAHSLACEYGQGGGDTQKQERAPSHGAMALAAQRATRDLAVALVRSVRRPTKFDRHPGGVLN